MVRRHEDQLDQIQADAYIDALLSRPMSPRLAGDERALDAELRRAIDALAELPRFHPSFAFEESLAARLREAAGKPVGRMAEVIRLPRGRAGQPVPSAAAQDVGSSAFGGIGRRLIVGGAIASGVSLAGIAGVAIAWRQRAR